MSDLRLLLIDDDEDMSILVRDLLSETAPEWTVDWAPTYEAGYERLTTGRYDAALLDYHLGAKTGVELLASVRSMDGLPPIVLLTGQGDRTIDLAAMATGASDYLDKGMLSPAMLERTVRHALERERALVDLRASEAKYLGLYTERVAAERALLEANAALQTSEGRFRRALDGVALHAMILDPEGRVLFVNQHLLARTGWTNEELIGSDAFQYLAPEYDRDTRRAAFRERARSGDIQERVESAWMTRTGDRVLVSWANSAIPDDEGRIVAIAAIGDDVTARREAEARQARLAAAVEQVAESILVTDAQGAITYANPAFERSSGYPAAALQGRDLWAVLRSCRSTSAHRRTARRVRSGQAWSGEWELQRPDGSWYREEVSISPVRGPDGSISSFVSVGRDMTQVRQMQASLDMATSERAAFARALARLQPRETLQDTAQDITDAVAELPGVEIATLLWFDEGHDVHTLAVTAPSGYPLTAGNVAPASRSAYLRRRAAEGPWAEAWLPRPGDGDHGRSLTEAGLRAAAYAPVSDGQQPIGLVALGTTNELTARTIADQLPAAIEFAAVARSLIAGPLAVHRRLLATRRRIEGIIRAGSFDPVFQPIVDLATGVAIGFEALTRFGDGSQPDVTFASAGSAGVGLALEAATLERIIGASRGLPAAAWLSLNVSGRMITEGDRLATILARRDRPVVLEITEHDPIQDYAAVRAAIALLGPDVRVAVDDAGAGVANFTHMVELRPDLVKVDVSLVRGVDHDLTRQALIVGLHHFAEAIHGAVIAEGVETQEERQALIGLGLRLGQGYLFGRPAAVQTWRSSVPRASVRPVAAARPSRRAAMSAHPAELSIRPARLTSG